jgi:hypothetical protein
MKIKKFFKAMFFISAIILITIAGFGMYYAIMQDIWDSSDYLMIIFGMAIFTNLFKVFSEE